MTAETAFTLVVAFTVLLWVLTLVFEQTARGRRFTERAIRFVLESRR